MVDIIERLAKWRQLTPEHQESVADKARTEIERLRASLAELRTAVALLQQNAEGCAVHHYGDDFQIHGMPGWLADTKASIDRAAEILNRKS